MPARRSGDTWFLHVEPGVQLHDAYRRFCKEQGIGAGVVLSGIGMVKDPVLGFYHGSGYDQQRLPGAFELVSTQGNVSLLDGQPFTHLHVCLGGAGHEARAGHLFEGEVHVAHEGVLRVLPGVDLVRQRDERTQLAGLRW